jgi:hypothetical protein
LINKLENTRVKIMRLIFVFLLLLFSFTINAEEIRPFTTDGCSAFPDGTFSQNELWLNCCTAHDYAYWQGGTYDERLIADNALQHCVAKVGQPEVATLMLAGVRVGGIPYLPTTFRWGYGWSYPRWYQALTDEEKIQIKSQNKIITE